jgi:antitoxin ParD1/3/4
MPTRKIEDANEVLRAELRPLEQETRTDEQRLAIFRKLAAEGFGALDEGGGLALPGERQLNDAIAKIGRRAIKAAGGRTLS